MTSIRSSTSALVCTQPHNSRIGDRHADTSRAFVMEAMQRLVDDHLAKWDRTEDGKVELRLATGETFVVGDAGITSTKAPRGAAPMRAINCRSRSMR